MSGEGLRLALFAVLVMAGGLHHKFMVPTLSAVVALTQVRDAQSLWVIFGAWLFGIVLASFLRP